MNSGWSTCSSHCGGGGGGGSGVEKSKRGGGGVAGGMCVCVFVCMFRRWQLRILKQTTVICLKGSLSTVFELWQREGGGVVT